MSIAIDSDGEELIDAGGRSRDYSEGRAKGLTDFLGFFESSSQSRCAEYRGSTELWEFAIGDLFILCFPQGRGPL